MDSVVHFEIPADDTSRASDFYKNTFGWNIVPVPEMQYTIVHTAKTDDKNMLAEPGAINGGMFKRNQDLEHPTLVMGVKDITASLEEIKKNGGTVVREKVPVGDMGFVAYFKDTEGNVLGLWETKR